mmetsp:Transcript_14383/g.40822  ORF Transcript_14383/g.40822 Transcript_14383/m.40822 type:complete len:363 (-) Transcript_14383:596-1684(-)
MPVRQGEGARRHNGAAGDGASNKGRGGGTAPNEQRGGVGAGPELHGRLRLVAIFDGAAAEPVRALQHAPGALRAAVELGREQRAHPIDQQRMPRLQPPERLAALVALPALGAVGGVAAGGHRVEVRCRREAMLLTVHQVRHVVRVADVAPQPQVRGRQVVGAVVDRRVHAGRPSHGLVEEELRLVVFAVYLREGHAGEPVHRVFEDVMDREVGRPTPRSELVVEQRGAADAEADEQVLLRGAGKEVEVGVGDHGGMRIGEHLQEPRRPDLRSQRARRAAADDQGLQFGGHVRARPHDRHPRVRVAALHDVAVGPRHVAHVHVPRAIDHCDDGVILKGVPRIGLVVDAGARVLRDVRLAERVV